MTDTQLTRRELAAIAVALLLPIPLLAASGLHIPLPGVIERGLASLTPVQQYEVAGVRAAIAPAVAEEAAATVAPATAAGPPSPVSTHSVSSTSIAAATTDAAAPRGRDHEDNASAEPAQPSASEPHTDEQTAPPENDTDPEPDLPVAPQAVAAEPAAASPTVEVEAAGASVEVAVTDDGVTLDTGGAADMEIPVASPPLPLPVPLPGLP